MYEADIQEVKGSITHSFLVGRLNSLLANHLSTTVVQRNMPLWSLNPSLKATIEDVVEGKFQ